MGLPRLGQVGMRHIRLENLDGDGPHYPVAKIEDSLKQRNQVRKERPELVKCCAIITRNFLFCAVLIRKDFFTF